MRRALGGLVALVAMACPPVAFGAEETFTSLPWPQSWTAPPHVTSATFDVYGAQGGWSIYFPDKAGGLGGRATATIDVVPGHQYSIYAGGRGRPPGDPTQLTSEGGEGSEVRSGPTPGSTRLIAAGGGGGGSYADGGPGGTEEAAGGSINGAGSPFAGDPGAGGASWGPPGTVYETGVRSGDGLVTVSYTVDTQPPVVQVTRRPKNMVKADRKQVKVRVGFTSTEPGTTFECRLDKEAYRQCGSPYSVRAKAQRRRGTKHRIFVRGADAAGNAATPVSVRFRAIRKG